MTTRDPAPSRGFYLMPAGFILVVAVLAIAIWQLHLDARRQIDQLGTANSDSTQWFLAQTEVELLSMHHASAMFAVSAAQPPDAAKTLRRRFDIFYSRIQTLRHGETYVALRGEPGVDADLEQVQRVLESVIPAIDGSDAGLRKAAAEITRQAAAIGPLVRDISLAGVRHF